MKIINLIENNPNVDFSIPFKMALESGENRITGINTLNRNFIKLKQAVDNDDRRADYERKSARFLYERYAKTAIVQEALL